jgi:hypothetical protein
MDKQTDRERERYIYIISIHQCILRQAKQKTSWQGSVVTTAVDLVPGSKDLSDLALPFCSPTVLPDFGQKNGRFRKKNGENERNWR